MIKWDIVTIAIYAVLAGTFDHLGFMQKIDIPLALSAFVGTTLSLLLAFRTSQSYECWWEARTVWGSIVNDSRTLIRQVRQFLPKNEEGNKVTASFAHRQVVWCFALSESLRKVPFSAKVVEYLESHALKSENYANFLLNKHAEELALASDKFAIDANKQIQVDATIARLCDAMGKCERIKNTVFPRSYSVLIHFLIYVLMTIMPFGLGEASKVVEILLTFMIPVLFIAIERTAIVMQDPFENSPTDTPMTTLSTTIERNLMEMIDQKVTQYQTSDSTYYIM